MSALCTWASNMAYCYQIAQEVVHFSLLKSTIVYYSTLIYYQCAKYIMGDVAVQYYLWLLYAHM